MNEDRESGDVRPSDGLERRIEDALRRRFEPPATLVGLPARALATQPRAPRLRPWIVLAALAAAVLAWLLPWGGARERESARPQRVAGLQPVPASSGPACRLGPLEPAGLRPGQVYSPDLVQLYSAMDACQRSAAALPCSDNDDLAARLAATYGDEIELHPEAVGFLQGPFGSADLPTATILTGTSENHTSVLVAERGATLDCCLCMNLPEDSGLRMFTWEVGDLVLTEITPLDEPRLLQFFE